MTDERERAGNGRMRTAGRAALGLGAAAAAAYGVYMLGSSRVRRPPGTELPNALGLRLDYVRWGDVHYAFYRARGRGRPVVLLHSINAVASAFEMRPLADELRAERRPLLAPEWLGFGHSDRPELEYSPELYEDQLEHFLETAVARRGPADLVGLSLGATYAAAVARRRPDLVRSLTAVEPVLDAEPPLAARAFARTVLALPGVSRAFYDRLTTAQALRRYARENLFSAGFGVPEEYVAYGAGTARVDGAHLPVDDFLAGRLFPDDPAALLAAVPQPLLVLYGTVEARRMEPYDRLPDLAVRPGVEVVGLPTGALPHWERPEEAADLILDFLARLDEDAAPSPRFPRR